MSGCTQRWAGRAATHVYANQKFQGEKNGAFAPLEKIGETHEGATAYASLLWFVRVGIALRHCTRFSARSCSRGVRQCVEGNALTVREYGRGDGGIRCKWSAHGRAARNDAR